MDVGSKPPVGKSPSESPAHRSGPPRALLAAVASAILHALFWLGSSLVDPPDAESLNDDNRPAEISFEVVAPPPRAPPPSALAATLVRPQETSEEDARDRTPSAKRRRNPAQPAAGEAGAEAGEPTGPPAPATGSAHEMFAIPSDPAGGVPLPSADQMGRAGLLAPGAGVAAEAPKPKGKSRWTESMDRRSRWARERANAQGGQGPPEAFDMLREIERRYQPSRGMVVDLVKANAGRARDADRWLGRYLGGFLDHDPTTVDQPFERETAYRRAVGNAALEYHARYCLSFDREGKPIIEADPASGIAGLDKMAEELVQQAAQRRGPGLGTASRVCYKFSARLERIPPIPVFACGLTADLRPECVWPLKEMASTRVTLDGLDFAAQSAGRPDAQ